MITVGPLTPTSGVALLENDPDKTGQGSVKVQVLNLSGFLITATVAGSQVPVPPFQAVTIATNKVPVLTLLPEPTAASSRGAIYLYWLLVGEESPVRDGIQTATLATYTAGYVSSPPSQTTANFDAYLYGVPFLATDAIVSFNVIGNYSDKTTITITGQQSGTVYLSEPRTNFAAIQQYQRDLKLAQGLDQVLVLYGFSYWINSGGPPNQFSIQYLAVEYHD